MASRAMELAPLQSAAAADACLLQFHCMIVGVISVLRDFRSPIVGSHDAVRCVRPARDAVLQMRTHEHIVAGCIPMVASDSHFTRSQTTDAFGAQRFKNL